MKKPSISELLKLLDKPALLNWANKQGLAGIDISKARKKWQSDGNSIHDQIDRYFKNGEPFLEKETETRCLLSMIGKEVIKTEVSFETEWFTGRYDMLCQEDVRRRIIDFKSNQKGIYLENKLQLVAYSMYEPCECFSIISVPDFTEIKVEIQDREPFIEILKALSIIYTNKNLIEYGEGN